jgi:hypothetical protein
VLEDLFTVVADVNAPKSSENTGAGETRAAETIAKEPRFPLG